MGVRKDRDAQCNKNLISGYIFGTWRSLVAHRVRDAGVASSNLVVPKLLFTF